MGDELETREKLLESAMAEFSENGYMKASLRKICADAGVTTGALYFFFKNKNDLFKAIVDKPLKELCRLLTEHYMQDAQDMDSDDPAVLSAEYHIDTHTDLFLDLWRYPLAPEYSWRHCRSFSYISDLQIHIISSIYKLDLTNFTLYKNVHICTFHRHLRYKTQT